MENYTLTVRSADRVFGTHGNFEIRLPVIPQANYKVIVSFIAADLSATTGYILQLKGGPVARSLETGVCTGWHTVCVFTGAQQANQGVLYYSGAPNQLEVRILSQVTGAIVDPTATQLLLHFQKLKSDFNNAKDKS